MFWDEGGEDFEVQIFLVSNSAGTTLDDSDFVVDAFDETEADLVVHLAIGHDSTPMTFDPLGELFEGAQSLPTQLGFPMVEELSGRMEISSMPMARGAGVPTRSTNF